MKNFTLRLNKKSNLLENPNLSIVLTVFNQIEIIEEVINQICNNVVGIFELIVVDDSSDDGTSELLVHKLSRLVDLNDEQHCSNLHRVKLIKSKISVFETKCDQIGIQECSSEAIILVQADIFILEYGFDLKLINALNSSKNIFLLSSRGVAPFNEKNLDNFLTPKKAFKKLLYLLLKNSINKVKVDNYLIQDDVLPDLKSIKNEVFPNSFKFLSTGSAGWRGNLLENWNKNLELSESSLPSSFIWLGDFPMRGPCILKRSIFLKLGGFNTKSFFLGGDIGDICLRAQLEFNMRSGFYPIKFKSPNIYGSMRKKRSIRQKFLYTINLVKCSFYLNKSRLYWIHSLPNREKFNFPKSQIINFK
jgi:glycosyltransferase involved in cell wall biosynthesis